MIFLIILIIIWILIMWLDLYVTSNIDSYIIWFNTLDGDRNFIKIKKIWKQ